MFFRFRCLSSAEESQVSSKYIQTSAIPSDIIQYAQNNVNRFISSDSETTANSAYSLGSPFSLENYNTESTVYYFPIICQNSIVATFRVAKYNGVCSGVYSSVLVEELNNIKSTETNPCYFYADSKSIYMVQNNNVDVVYTTSADNVSEPLLARSAASIQFNAVDCMSVISSGIRATKTDPVSARSLSSNPSFYTVANAESKCSDETQGSEPWCAAYVAAFIVRCRTNSSSPTAAAVMATVYPGKTPAELQELSLYDSDARMYYQGRGYTATLGYTRINNANVQSFILANKPIHLLCANVVQGANHSLSLVGYNTPNQTYKIWNPWYSFLELMDQTTFIYVAPNGTQYKWVGQITVS